MGARRHTAEARQSILNQILHPEAADRLGRIRLVKEQRATDVENRLIMLAQSGQLRSKVTEEQLKEKQQPPVVSQLLLLWAGRRPWNTPFRLSRGRGQGVGRPKGGGDSIETSKPQGVRDPPYESLDSLGPLRNRHQLRCTTVAGS